MHATKAAIEEGIVPGGGVALLRASSVLDTFARDKEEGEGAGVRVRTLPPVALALSQLSC